MVKPDEYGAGDLMHARSPTNYPRGKERTRGVLAAIRQHLKKANYHNFHDLLHAFQHYDKNGSGKVDINELREVCVQFNLPVDAVLLEQLMDYCDVDRDGYINYIEFSNFLNWKDKMPTGQPEVIQSHPGTPKLVKEKDLVAKSPTSRESTPRRIQKQIDAAMVDHRTSASLINATVGGISTKDYRTYGVPTIRTDKAAPRIRRVCDRTNYGDESDAFGLVNPSIFSTRGLSEKDFLRARPKEEIRQVFTNIGVHMTLGDFDKIYDQAASFDPRGQVSIELFRSVLDQNEAGRIIVE
ncbi:unnamed protein product [Owenia fusiformis]|uniref:Uncharacterized protein n=1 Tax=Owenia fusiformis TaxID=6347 RepID=A0A8J1UZD0_OWEFU|nr:unnamed protein product [Owenia fusiformis]